MFSFSFFDVSWSASPPPPYCRMIGSAIGLNRGVVIFLFYHNKAQNLVILEKGLVATGNVYCWQSGLTSVFQITTGVIGDVHSNSDLRIDYCDAQPFCSAKIKLEYLFCALLY